MAILTKELRNQLSKVVLEARDAAERAAQKVLHTIGVDEPDVPQHLSADGRLHRRALRAQAKQLGDKEDPRKKGRYDLYHLTEKIAYDQWHRMLFARFLAENDLLIAPRHGVPVSLQECRELAPELGLRDEWDVAVRFAAEILPQIFRPDDPAGKIELAPEDRSSLRNLVISLPRDVFLADDSLGWVYQFWQAKRKDDVNKSEKKIGADEIAPVTQLFTEHYMVLFLLHNTLGSWWVAKRKAEGKDSSLNGIEFQYLRLREDGTPAAGTFCGWPKQAKDLRVLDPCMGSGHFLITELPILVSMRMEEEGLSKADACDAVLRDNLFGLEIDARCTQIAAFNLALAAWKLAGYRQLPALNLACSGLGINTRKEEWLKLANGDDRLSRGMEQLYQLFEQASVLGSLIDPKRLGGDLLVAEFHELQPLLEKALSQEKTRSDENLAEMSVTAKGLAQAAEILAERFTLVATNVPYLGRPDQDEKLKAYSDRYHRDARSDLATCFLERSLSLCTQGASVALVNPQSWLFQPGYKKFRKRLLETQRWEFLARLGPRAFEMISGERVNVCLLVLSHCHADLAHRFNGVDVTDEPTATDKQRGLVTAALVSTVQADQVKNPDFRITLEALESHNLLAKHAVCVQGLATSDDPQFTCCFWELSGIVNGWEGLMGTVEKTTFYGGRERLIHWEDGVGRYFMHAQALKAEGRLGGWKSGTEARGRTGVLVSQMSTMPVTIYTGEFYDHNASVIVMNDLGRLPAVWAFASSPTFAEEVRKLDKSLKPSNNVFVKVPFDFACWERVATEKYPDGLPKPSSEDPTQWIFNGRPIGSTAPLQVAVARLLGYRWPRQMGSSFPDCLALGPDGLEKFIDGDGIVCINPIKGEQLAAEKLRALLAEDFGSEWTTTKLNELLVQVGYGGKTLEDWLRNGFFEQHCQLFHQRPFIWHIWDGRRDGFSALVNYHRLNRSNLERLTYTFLGDWIARQKAANDAGEEGSDARLQAALELKSKLEKIIEGQPPYDMFIRWKPLPKQPIGWEPDLNDGVRLNIRPFVQADVLRKNPNVHWKKDKGKDVMSAPWYKMFKGERINDHHLTFDEKRKARSKS